MIYDEIMSEYNLIIDMILEKSYINCIFLVCILVGGTLTGISVYSFVVDIVTKNNVIIFGVGLFLLSPLIITLCVLIVLRLLACIFSIIFWDSKPIVKVPVVASVDRTGRPKSNSPLSVLRVV